jgi:hypothetical protein
LSANSPPANGSFFDCEVNISTVYNATAIVHEFPDSSAVIAAGSIALAGYSIGPDQWEYVRYPPESPWSLSGDSPLSTAENSLDASNAAFLASRFAIGAIAAKDLYGPTTLQYDHGMTARVGVLLVIKWTYLLLILAGILAAQLCLGLGTVFWANSVVCKDDSFLSTARLLRPVVERLGDSGCALTGRDIASTLVDGMVYGVRTGDGGQRHHLDLGADVVPMKRFPNGWYDGGLGEESRFGSALHQVGKASGSSGSSSTGVRRKKLGLRKRRKIVFK